MTDQKIIAHTVTWINEVVIGCNFCPFAAREMKRGSIHYEVLAAANSKKCLETLTSSFRKLDAEKAIETLLIIIPGSFLHFDEYLLLVEKSENLMRQLNYEGVYQIASFHPDYRFAGSGKNDPANFTNRSPYPMLHLLREESVSRAIASYPDTAEIPKKNIAFARARGLAFMQALKDSADSGS